MPYRQVGDFYNKQKTYAAQREIESMINNARIENDQADQQRLDAVNEEFKRRENADLDAQFADQMERQQWYDDEKNKRLRQIAELENQQRREALKTQSKTLDAARPFMMNTPGVIDLIRPRNGKLPSRADFRQNSQTRLNRSMSPTRRNDSPPRVTFGGRLRSNRVRLSIRATRTHRGTRTRSGRTHRGTQTRRGTRSRTCRNRRVVRKQ